jgi:hypothetical protein
VKIILSAGILLAAVVLLFTGCGGIKQATAEQMKHEWFREFPGVSRDVIFDRAVRWTAQNFISNGRIIEIADRKTGSIVANGIKTRVFHVPEDRTWVDGDMKYTMTLDVKDGVARFSYTFKVLTDGGKENRDAASYKDVNLAAHRELEAVTDCISNTIAKKGEFE